VAYELTEYRPSDQQYLLRFFAEVLGELGFEFDPGAKDADLLRVPDLYQSGGGTFLLAKHGGDIVGTVALRRLGDDDDTCELKRFYARQDHRGRGLGAALLDAALAHAKDGPWRRVRLDTTSRSRVAIAMFGRRGFVEIPRYNDDPFAELFMELRLR
jgi:GNAT superfamily N-acetyltransferase